MCADSSINIVFFLGDGGEVTQKNSDGGPIFVLKIDYSGKGDVGNAILDTKGKIVFSSFLSMQSQKTGVS